MRCVALFAAAGFAGAVIGIATTLTGERTLEKPAVLRHPVAVISVPVASTDPPPQNDEPAWESSDAPQSLVEPDSPPSDVYYAGCNEVRAAGLAPLYRGQPGYRPEMDGDNDGIACEAHRVRPG